MLKHASSAPRGNSSPVTAMSLAVRGEVVGVDACVWMHQLAYAYAIDLMDGDYAILGTTARRRAQAAIGKGLNIVLVFGGGQFSVKCPTNKARAERRTAHIAQVYHGEAAPDKLAVAATQTLGWHATTVCMEALMEALRKLSGIAYVVAPYEADSHLAYTASQGLIDSAWTVDSDFVIHGIKRTYFKVSWRTCWCSVVDYQRLLQPSDDWHVGRKYDTAFSLALTRFKAPFLKAYVVAAACDYGTKVKGVGSAKAVMAITDAATRGAKFQNTDLDGDSQHLALALKDLNPDLDVAEW